MKTLKLGSRGKEVRELQIKLGIEPDGIFGKNTERIVINFQRENNLIADGIVGKSTWSKIEDSYNKKQEKINPVVIKIGSKGEIVSKLQKRLDIKETGFFDRKTEDYVKKMQAELNLKVDGIVGPVTWEKLGFILENNKYEEDTYYTDNKLTINKYFLPDGEYYTGSIPKYIFLHHTAGWNNPYKTIDSWGRDTRGKIATEFVIGGQSIEADEFKYDGELLQSFPEGGWAWHLGTGRNSVHINSVGIELNNFGYLTKGGYREKINGIRKWINKDSEKYYTYSGVEVHPSQIIKLDKPFRGYTHWHKYSDKQIETLRKLIIYISERDNINMIEGLPSLIKKKGISAFDYIKDLKNGKIKGGVWSHTNVRLDKFDVSPQPNLIDMLINL